MTITEYFFIAIGVLAIIGTMYSFWGFGHKEELSCVYTKYKTTKEPSQWSMKSKVIRYSSNSKWRQYSSFDICFSSEGLWLKFSIKLMRWAIPSILVPWKELEAEKIETHILWQGVRITFANCPESIIVLPGSSWKQLAPYLNNEA